MNRHFSEDRKREMALLYQVLKASFRTNTTAGHILGVPWITLYKWGQKYFNLSGYHHNPKIQKLLNKAGEAIAEVRVLPIHRTPRRKKSMSKREKTRIARMRKLEIEAFVIVRKRGHSPQEASKTIGKPLSTLMRWEKLYQQRGLKGLIPYASR